MSVSLIEWLEAGCPWPADVRLPFHTGGGAMRATAPPKDEVTRWYKVRAKLKKNGKPEAEPEAEPAKPEADPKGDDVPPFVPTDPT